MNFNIQPLPSALDDKLKLKIDRKAKPLGSLGQLEKIAYRIGRIQQSLNPQLKKPTVIVVGGDHGICEEGVSPCPIEITWQQMINMGKGGAAIGMFSSFYGWDMLVVDAGANYDFKPEDNIIDAKVAHGTKNFLHEPAMTMEECEKAMKNGADIVEGIYEKGCNVVAFGEMGIGNTSPASIILSKIAGIAIEDCVGPGSGLDDEGVNKKKATLKQAMQNHQNVESPMDILATFGGLEIATIAGGMLKAAELKMLILNDGFIITSALLIAQALNKNVLDYVIFSHASGEQGHAYMLEHMNADPVLDLSLRLGEGTGAVIAYPVLQGAVEMINKMTSFDDVEVTDTTGKGIRILD
ncbi:nicotinate-nucleotide--dimethylbenzimidazole phosphoribosyltransferase [Puteibacter caeruleilacunae]|nr:nicotinate-nucleotide--dimethylbenzimidazole phosphoribosyltransferase [Puteibacter caeruleilacunae]